MIQYNFPILFLVLELVAVLLIFSHNPIPRGRLAHRMNSLSTSLYDKTFNLTQYIHLRKDNEQLAKENSFLRAAGFYQAGDSAFSKNGYEFMPGQVINNSVNKEFNYLTLNIGSLSGVEPDMAVVSPFGIVGVVKTVTPNFSRVISLLNPQLKVSVVLSKTGHFGSLFWDGRNYREVILAEIPSHVLIEPGDSIVTSGFSALFPKGEPVAIVEDSKPVSGGNFLEIRARLTNDFKQLNTVYVVRNLLSKEINQIEEGENEE